MTIARPASRHAVSTAETALALEVTDLQAGYQRNIVLRHVNVAVAQSSVTSLLGPNGAGKTTLLRAIGGFLAPSRGSIRMAGRDVTHLAAHRRFADGLCQIPEGRGVFRSLTVHENIQLQAAKRERASAFDKATAAFPVLGTRRNQRVGTLSGGEQQMVAMAGAYVRDARLITVDEPSLGLAPLIVDQVFEAIQALAASGIAMLVVDQFATRALELASTAYVLRRGQISYAGAAADLINEDLFKHYLGTGGEP